MDKRFSGLMEKADKKRRTLSFLVRVKAWLRIRRFQIQFAVRNFVFRITGMTVAIADGCKCPLCGHVEYGHRLGCQCWNDENVDAWKMEYGVLVATDKQHTDFLSYQDMKNRLAAGEKFTWMDGENISLSDFDA